MSGGRLDYLAEQPVNPRWDYYRDVGDYIAKHCPDAETAASDVKLLIDLLHQVAALHEKLGPVARAVEWALSGDWDDEQAIAGIRAYPKGNQ
jgi:hypothetical protein